MVQARSSPVRLARLRLGASVLGLGSCFELVVVIIYNIVFHVIELNVSDSVCLNCCFRLF